MIVMLSQRPAAWHNVHAVDTTPPLRCCDCTHAYLPQYRPRPVPSPHYHGCTLGCTAMIGGFHTMLRSSSLNRGNRAIGACACIHASMHTPPSLLCMPERRQVHGRTMVVTFRSEGRLGGLKPHPNLCDRQSRPWSLARCRRPCFPSL